MNPIQSQIQHLNDKANTSLHFKMACTPTSVISRNRWNYWWLHIRKSM